MPQRLENPICDSIMSPVTRACEAGLHAAREESWIIVQRDTDLDLFEKSSLSSHSLLVDVSSLTTGTSLIHISFSEIDSAQTEVRYLFLERRLRPFGDYEAVKEKLSEQDLELFTKISEAIRNAVMHPGMPRH
jgi:hypothetical protein